MKRALKNGLSALLLPLSLVACGAEGPPPAPLEGPSFETLERPDTPGNNLQFNFEPGDVVEAFPSPSGKFLIHFTRNGTNAVPAADADVSGTPDFVEQVADVYDEVITHYEGMGFRAPKSDEAIADNGGDGKFDVYLVDFAGIGDGTFRVDECDVAKPDVCTGYMVQENDYAGYGYPSTLVANRILGSHELFHGIQAAYDHGQGSVFAEGTAVWATESFDPSLKDFEYFLDGYLDNADRSLDVPLPGPVDPFSYGSAIFFRFLEERYGDGTVRTLMEHTEDGSFGKANPVWIEEIDPVLQGIAKTSFADAFVEFATWNLFTGAHADPARGYASGAGYPPLKMRPAVAPYTELMRVFYASAQYFRTDPLGRKEMTTAIVAPEGSESQLDGLAVLQLVEVNGQWGPVLRLFQPSDGTQAIDTTNASAYVAIVVNTAISGNSKRPTLCIGSPEEVAACKTTVVSPGSGAGGAGGAGVGGGDPAPPGEEGGCGCSLSPTSPNPGIFALLALGSLGYRRARRRSARPAKTTP